jgi:S1-C subfamily serine protease
MLAGVVLAASICLAFTRHPTSASAAEDSAAPTQAVLAAEAERVATIERISRPTLAIFDSKGQGGGSGVIISADGYAITNFHVTAPCGPAMKCGLSDGRLVDATRCSRVSIREGTWR